MSNLEIFNFDLKKEKKDLPKNIYAFEIFNVDKNETFKIAIQHDGYCPIIDTDRKLSHLFEYLCNLQGCLLTSYFKANKLKEPKSYHQTCEIMTNSKGELYHYSYSID